MGRANRPAHEPVGPNCGTAAGLFSPLPAGPQGDARQHQRHASDGEGPEPRADTGVGEFVTGVVGVVRGGDRRDESEVEGGVAVAVVV